MLRVIAPTSIDAAENSGKFRSQWTFRSASTRSTPGAAAPGVERVDADRKVHWLRNLPEFSAASIDVGAITRSIKELQPVSPAFTAPQPQIPWGVARVGAPQVWAKTQGEGASIAVIDTG